MASSRNYYEPIARWAAKHLGCFVTGIEEDLRLGRMDVVGLRDADGRLSGRAEVVSIEVSSGRQPFVTSRTGIWLLGIRRPVLPRRVPARRLHK